MDEKEQLIQELFNVIFNWTRAWENGDNSDNYIYELAQPVLKKATKMGYKYSGEVYYEEDEE